MPNSWVASSLRRFADGGVVAPNDPADAQIEARKLRGKRVYRGVTPAGLPPSFVSQPLVGSDITIDVGGKQVTLPSDPSYDESPERYKAALQNGSMSAGSMGIRPGVLAQMIQAARTAAEESSYLPSKWRNQTPPPRSVRSTGEMLSPGLGRYADGGVVTPQQSTWERLWSKLMGKEALQRAAGEQAPPPPPQNTDISIVKKAAEAAGKRNEEEKAREAARAASSYR